MATQAPAGTGEEMARNRGILAEARRRIQVRLVPLGAGGLIVARLSRIVQEAPGVAVAYVVLVGGLAIRWIVGYRRLKAELGFVGEYDDLDENAAWGGKTLLVVFGGGAAFFLLLFGFMSVAGKH